MASRARAPGASAAEFEVAATVPLIVTDDVEAAADAVRPMYALYFGGMGAKSANFHADVADPHGLRAPRCARSRSSTSPATRIGRGRSPDQAHRGADPDRLQGEDPRRPGGLARVARHHAADQRRLGHAAHRRRARARLASAGVGQQPHSAPQRDPGAAEATAGPWEAGCPSWVACNYTGAGAASPAPVPSPAPRRCSPATGRPMDRPRDRARPRRRSPCSSRSSAAG